MDQPKIEFNGSSRHYFAKPRDHIFKLFDQTCSIINILKDINNPLRNSIINHIKKVMKMISIALTTKKRSLESLFPPKKIISHINNSNEKNNISWKTSSINFSYVLVNILSIQELEIDKIIYLFNLEKQEEINLRTISSWIKSEALIDQYFDYYLIVKQDKI